MKLIKIYSILLFILIPSFGFSQEIRNLRVNQSANRVIITYDLVGNGVAKRLDLYYSLNEGKSWVGPLLYLSGDISDISAPATDRRIVWDAQTEKGVIEGTLQFKIEAEFAKMEVTQNKFIPSELKESKILKTLWLTSALIAAGTGTYCILRSNGLYDDYHTAEENAGDIHKKIEKLDNVYPVAFGITAISTVGFIISSVNQTKLKKQLSLRPLYLPNGGGVALTLGF